MRYFPVICIAVLLFFTFRVYNDAYLYTDDFNNLYWVQQASGGDIALHVLNPASRNLRPVGMLLYWFMLHFFDLNVIVYHWTAWGIHALNTLLVYVVLKRYTESRAGAIVGAMLFASQANFADIYWNFGTIFDLVSGCAFFGGLFLWMMKPERSWARVLICTLVFLFAIQAKEMAFTLPVIWFLCDVLLREKSAMRNVAQVMVPAAVAILTGIPKFYGIQQQTNPRDLHFMDLQSITLGRSMGAYFNSLFGAELRWQYWTIAFAALLLLFALRRNRQAIFFQAYLLITFLPVIFMTNHRETYLSYIPFLGICGLAALLVKSVVNLAETYLGARRAESTAYLLLPLLCIATFVGQRVGSEERRAWQRPMSADYRAFMLGMRALSPPPPNETVFFDSHPLYLSESLLNSATQVAFRRTDIVVKLVPAFPEGAHYKVHYEDSKVTRVD